MWGPAVWCLFWQGRDTPSCSFKMCETRLYVYVILIRGKHSRMMFMRLRYGRHHHNMFMWFWYVIYTVVWCICDGGMWETLLYNVCVILIRERHCILMFTGFWFVRDQSYDVYVIQVCEKHSLIMFISSITWETLSYDDHMILVWKKNLLYDVHPILVCERLCRIMFV